jgi:hypothetical protein
MSGYIGTQPVPQATQTRDSFTATSGQTSFATGGYTPNFLDVYLNGVKLAAADYTASNGSDVVLASGASTGDILEVVAYTAFDTANVTGATNFTVTGAFTSQGIDDNGNATAMTIDSSENVLYGTTDTTLYNNTTGTGTKIGGDGRLDVARQADTVATFNRTGSSDGEVIRVVASGATVGAIQARSSFTTLQIGSTGTGITGTSSHKILPSVNNARSDNTNDLGDSSYRWKDAYLSGGVYLGGTVGANKLEDYEEGTWTPSLVGYSGTPTFQDSYYTKIGRIVFATCRVALDGTSDGSTFVINNLPFTCLGSTASIFGSNIVYSNSTTAPTYSLVAVGTTQINFYDASGTTISYTSAGVNKSFRINITYFTT